VSGLASVAGRLRVITVLLDDILRLKPGAALKVRLAELPDSKENIRSALSRAAAQRKLKIATSSNREHLFIWRTGEEDSGNSDGDGVSKKK
jgi:hypothetical protein